MVRTSRNLASLTCTRCIIDLSLLSLGVMLVLIWEYNPYALLLFALPIYLIYSTMRVPALERQSEMDQKTGLFNHAYFMNHLESELKRANRFDRPLTIIMADLDLLRNINNTYGHLAGDEVLIGVANILKNPYANMILLRVSAGKNLPS